MFLSPRSILAALLMFFVSGCFIIPESGSKTGKSGLTEESETVFQEALGELSAGRYKKARELFDELAGVDELACQIDYGRSLAGILEIIAEIDVLVDLAETFAGEGESALAPAQINGDIFLDSFFGPFDQFFASTRKPGERAIASGCELLLPEGLPIVLTVLLPSEDGSVEDTGFDFEDISLSIGYEFDTAFLHMVLAGIDAAQAGLDFVLAHKFSFEKEFTDALEVFGDEATAFTQSQDDVADGDKSKEERKTWVSVARSAGAIFDLNPNLLALRNGGKIEAVDDDLERMARHIFYREPGGSESGILPDLFLRSHSDELTDNVLAIFDNDNNSVLSAGDRILIGLRSADVPGGFVVGDLRSGIEYVLPSDVGDIAEAVRLFHELVQNLGNQMEAVEDSSVSWERFSIAQFNQLSAVLDDIIEPFPEVAEFDLRAYFLDPVAIRYLLPFWYDDGTGDTDVFLIEGESAVTTNAESFIAGEDASHFPDSIKFGPINEFDPETIEDLSIPADGLFAGDEGFEMPFPYIAFQDPSFGNLLYVNMSVYPVAPEGGNEFSLSTHYSLNKGVNSIGLHYSDEIQNALGN